MDPRATILTVGDTPSNIALSSAGHWLTARTDLLKTVGDGKAISQWLLQKWSTPAAPVGAPAQWSRLLEPVRTSSRTAPRS